MVPTLSSRNQSNVGPEMITIPIQITKVIENRGIAASVSFSPISSFRLDNMGSKTKAKKITPPIQAAATKLCT